DFNQFIRLDESALATIFEKADDELVVLSLWGAPLGLVEKVLQQFPTWRAEAIRRELADLGPVRLSDVEEARRRLAEYASKLAACRRIRLPPELQSHPVATGSARSPGSTYGL
ncbi:MAG TPA: FliG C-terminal domain-containing protein, partial [Thermogutta sp.]|nr:FliG C-terminal domain-containing protein [Thermogutta sp.]